MFVSCIRVVRFTRLPYQIYQAVLNDRCTANYWYHDFEECLGFNGSTLILYYHSSERRHAVKTNQEVVLNLQYIIYMYTILDSWVNIHIIGGSFLSNFRTGFYKTLNEDKRKTVYPIVVSEWNFLTSCYYTFFLISLTVIGLQLTVSKLLLKTVQLLVDVRGLTRNWVTTNW